MFLEVCAEGSAFCHESRCGERLLGLQKKAKTITLSDY
jgi:hypothetical protein